MLIYVMPAAVGARLQERLTEAQRLLDVEVFDAKLFQFDIVYTGEERKAFGITQDASLLVIAADGPTFEEMIPERKDGQLNYLRLNNQTAVAKIEARLSDVRTKLRGPSQN